jgi:acyl transferase domain-containing protein
MARYPDDTTELIEAHGTGTTVGDVVEVDGLKKAFSKLGYTRTNYCGLSSVKSNIGHLKSAAGIAGLIKGILALHHKKLPPTASIQNINPKLALQDSPFYVLDELKDWEENPNFPRRANVSAFGFGGADYHLALEEYREGDYSSKNYLIESYIEKEQQTVSSNIGIQNKWKESSSVVYFSADSFYGLKTELENFRQRLFSESELNRAEFVKLHNLSSEIEKGHRLSFFVQSLEEIIDKIELFITKGNQLASEILKTKGIYYKNSEPVTPDQIAILFPGQASQYVNMFSGMKRDVQIFENIFDKADSFWLKKHAFTVSSLIYGDEDKTDKLIDDLKETQNTHPSIFAASYALFKYLSDNGLKANYMIGHSLGEITALAAAEKIDFSEALQLVSARGYSFKDAELDDNGKMISVAKNYEESEGLIKESGLKGISIANINSKKQTIIAGSSKEIEKFKSYLDANKISNKTLYVSHAFHTDLMKPVGELFFDRTKNIRFHKSPIKVIMNHTGKFYPNSEEKNGEIIKSLTDQIVQPVNFVRSIEKLYDKGVKVFVEIGPNSVLTSLTKNILEEKDVSVLTSNFKNSDDIEAIQKLNASLFAEGIFLNPISSK